MEASIFLPWMVQVLTGVSQLMRSFGLCNAHSTYQRIIDLALMGAPQSLSNIDDTPTFSKLSTIICTISGMFSIVIEMLTYS